MIKNTFAALMLAATGVGGAAVLNQTFGGTYFFPETIAISITVLGMVFGLYFGVEKPSEEGDQFPEVEGQQQLSLVGVLAIVSLAAFAVFTFVFRDLTFLPGSVTATPFWGAVTLPTQSLSDQVGSFVFTCVTIPNAEEQFFRAFWGNLMLRIFPSGIAELMSGVVFMIFHTAVYSLLFPMPAWNIMFILIGAGATFVAVDSYTQDLTTSVLGHMGNNALSFLVGGSIVTKIFPTAHLPWAPQAAVVVFPMTLLLYQMNKKGDLRAYMSKLTSVCKGGLN